MADDTGYKVVAPPAADADYRVLGDADYKVVKPKPAFDPIEPIRMMGREQRSAAQHGLDLMSGGTKELLGLTPIGDAMTPVQGIGDVIAGAYDYASSPLAPLLASTNEANQHAIAEPITRATGSKYLGQAAAGLFTGVEGMALAPEAAMRPKPAAHLPVERGIAGRVADVAHETPPNGAKPAAAPLNLAESQVVHDVPAQAARAAEPTNRDVSSQPLEGETMGPPGMLYPQTPARLEKALRENRLTDAQMLIEQEFVPGSKAQQRAFKQLQEKADSGIEDRSPPNESLRSAAEFGRRASAHDRQYPTVVPPMWEEPPAGGKPPIIPPEPPIGGPPDHFFNPAPPDGEPPSSPITAGYLRSLEDDLFRDQQASHADMQEVVQNLKQTPEALRDPKLQEKFYHYIEWLRGYHQADEAMRVAGPEFQSSRHFVPDVELTPEERTLFDEYLEPLKEMESRLGKRAMDYGFDDVDLNYMHRRARGHTPELDNLMGMDTPSPQLGRRGLPTKTSSMKERKYFALQATDGSRRVVSRGPDGLAIWQNNKPHPFKFKGKIEPGSTVKVDGQPFLVTEARTSEIEQHTPARYYKNALANTLDNVIKLRRVNRNIERLEKIKSTPEWHANAARVDENGHSVDGREIPPTWRETKLPQMKGWAMDRRMADIFDDLAGHEFNTLEEALGAINKVTIGSLFWNPMVHLMNVTSHWYTSRGWDNYTPLGMKSIMNDGYRAYKAVIERNTDYQRYLREGGGLVFAGIDNKAFYTKMLKIFGESVERDVKQYGELGPMGKIARSIGYERVHDFIAAFYGASNKVLWAGNDMLMMARYLELERGRPSRLPFHDRPALKPSEAIREAEKHIPNYRLPSRIGLGETEAGYKAGRAAMQAAGHPLFEFSRYHYGQWKSWAKLVESARKAINDPKEAWELTGHLVALGAFMTFINVVAGGAVRYVTGNDQAKMRQPGAGHLPEVLIDYFNGDTDSLGALFNLYELSPLPRTLLELKSGHNLYSGKDIAPASGLRGDAQMADYTLSQLINPYQMAGRVMQGDSDVLSDSLKAILENSFMVSDPAYNVDAVRAKANQKKMYMDLYRQRQPRGPLEALTGR